MENISIPVAGGCPKCGTQGVEVPEDYTGDTIIHCHNASCRHKAPHCDFWKAGDNDQK